MDIVKYVQTYKSNYTLKYFYNDKIIEIPFEQTLNFLLNRPSSVQHAM